MNNQNQLNIPNLNFKSQKISYTEWYSEIYKAHKKCPKCKGRILMETELNGDIKTRCWDCKYNNTHKYQY
jgi:phage FluMu protein Com